MSNHSPTIDGISSVDTGTALSEGLDSASAPGTFWTASVEKMAADHDRDVARANTTEANAELPDKPKPWYNPPGSIEEGKPVGGRSIADSFRTSTFSSHWMCVAVAMVDGGIYVRDSKDPDGPVLTFTPDEWRAFVLGVKNEEFEVPGDWIGNQKVLPTEGTP